MEYTIKEIAKMAGISTRTLRYYDKINLLKPAMVNPSGYRVYSSHEVSLLQQVLLYKTLGLPLEAIKQIIYNPTYNYQKALEVQLKNLHAKKDQIEQLIVNVEKSLQAIKGEVIMKDEEKFIGLKEKTLLENEKKYGEEIRKRYGDETVVKANEQFLKMTKDDYMKVNKLATNIFEGLKKALVTNDPKSEEAQEVAKLHQEWLKFYWPNYQKEAHINLVKMYLEDERFKAYYDQVGPGACQLLTDAVIYFLTK